MARKMKIARPAARKTSGPRTQKARTTARGGSSRPSARSGGPRKPEPEKQVAEAATPRRRFVELPKIQGELPTPTATFYF